ncbi:putative mitochondrial protein, conserved [Actinomortierella wolfii]|nr:putative mitochondrial protein, conserved [Actinomortierella wolfii]
MLTTVLLRSAISTAAKAHVCAAPATTAVMRFYSSKGFGAPSPGPIPLGDPKEQAEFERLVRQFNEALATDHPDAREPVLPEFEGDTNPVTGEIGGPKREPVRYGEWSFGGKVVDF